MTACAAPVYSLHLTGLQSVAVRIAEALLYLEITPDCCFRIGIGSEDGAWLQALKQVLLPQKTQFLDDNLDNLQHFYRHAHWLHANLPYELIADAHQLVRPGWLRVICSAVTYDLPIELEAHRRRVVELFWKAGRLRCSVGNQPDNQLCPRIRSCNAGRGEIEIQQACYSDQVATNLSLDLRLEKHVANFGETLRTVDRNYVLRGHNLCKQPLRNAQLRPLESSFLANTLGVACIVVFRNGEYFYRQRSTKTAIYGGSVHVPVSFAVEYDQEAGAPETLEQMVLRDLVSEFNQETRLDFDAVIDTVTPLGLCRDLGRGGKPQLFLKLQARNEPGEFLQAMQRAISTQPVNEYQKAPTLSEQDRPPEAAKVSPELACARYLLQSRPGIAL